MSGWLGDLYDAVTEVSDSPVTYLVVFVACAFDVLFPVIPSETVLIASSVLAAQGDLLIVAIVPAAAVGAILGDNASYSLGRFVGDPVADRLFSGEKGRSRLEWAEGAIRRHGVVLILVGRFIPGGRTASTFAAGTLGMEYRRFLPADVFAAAVWAIYVSLLGYVSGSTFEDKVWLPLLIAFGIAMLISVAAEGWRRFQKRRGKDLLGDKLEET